MKRQILLITLSLITGTCFAQSLVDSIITLEKLQKDVSVLAADSLEGRLFGSAGADKAATYISNRFKEIGLKPLDIYGGFSMPVNGSLGNIIGAIPGKSRAKEIVIFSGHYDHVGLLGKAESYMQNKVRPKKTKDSIFNGANDNASGIAFLLALAEYLVLENKNEKTIIFIAFTGEEQGFIGSKSFAATISNPASIKAVINFDMVGIPFNKKGGAFVAGNNTAAIIGLFNKTIRSNYKTTPKNFFVHDPFPLQQLDSRSDHVPFQELGIYAVSIMSTSPYNDYYHTVNDEIQTLDFPFLLKFTKVMAHAVTALITDTAFY